MLRKISFIIGSRIKEILLAAISGLLLVLSFPKLDFGLLAWIGFVPVFLAATGASNKKAFFLFYLSGVIFWSGTIYWLACVTFFGAVILALYLALYFGFFGLISKNLNCGNKTAEIFILPAIWVILEYIRGHLLTGFGWNLLGYSQYRNYYLIQSADLIGAYGISFLVVFINSALLRLLLKKELTDKFKTVLILTVVIGAAIFYGDFKLKEKEQNSESVKIAVVQGNIPQHLKWEPELRSLIFDKYIGLTGILKKDYPDLIVWPETAVPYQVDSSNNSAGYIGDIVKENISAPLLFGCISIDEDRLYNSALFLNKSFSGRYDKIHLVPFGEYIPFRKEFPLLEYLVNIVMPIGDFNRGEESKVFDFKVPFSVLICFEDTISELAVNSVRNGAKLIINITNDAWFMDTSSAYQHLQASVFRAVENRVPVVRAANTGISCFIDSKGRIDYLSGKNNKKTFVDAAKTNTVRLNKDNPPTFYNRYPDVIIYICWFMISCAIIFKITIFKRKKC